MKNWRLHNCFWFPKFVRMLERERRCYGFNFYLGWKGSEVKGRGKDGSSEERKWMVVLILFVFFSCEIEEGKWWKDDKKWQLYPNNRTKYDIGCRVNLVNMHAHNNFHQLSSHIWDESYSLQNTLIGSHFTSPPFHFTPQKILENTTKNEFLPLSFTFFPKYNLRT